MNNNNYEKALEFYNNEEYEKAIEVFRVLAEEGDSDSQFNLARMYNNGQGVDVDYAKALFWYAKAAEQGLAVAQNNLALMYEKGKGIEIDYTKALYWYNKAVEKGHQIAQYNLARMYRDGKGIEADYDKAIFWCSKSAEQGFYLAQNDLAVIYYEGRGVTVDYVKAIYWYEKAAEKGYATAQFNLATMYYNGKGVQQDYVKAIYWYKKAAKQGDVDAQLKLAVIYEKGKVVDADYTKAIYWYKKAAKQGNLDAISILACMYYDGEYYAKALYWYEQAAKRGDMYAQETAAIMYEIGEGVEKDYSKALHWYEQAAKQGSAYAQTNLGEAYFRGKGLEQNYKKAFSLFYEASKKEDCPEDTFYYLGECYYYGYGIKADWQKAKEYYQKAVDNGYNCRYALEMVKRDLNEYDTINGIQKYAKETISKKLFPSDLILKIRKDLEEDFGEYWNQLNQNAQKALISGVFSYINFYSLGEEFYKDLDFTPCITAMAKALEIELAEFFFKHYLAFLKEKGASPTEFNEKQCFINVDEEDIYSFTENHETFRFSLGALWYVIDAKMEAPLEIQKERFGRSEIYRKTGKAIITISKYMVEFADELFKENAFSLANREKEIVNYLVDLAADVRDIKKIRNPAAHSDTMTCAQAEVCGDYLIKVRKLICNILSKIKDEYK